MSLTTTRLRSWSVSALPGAAADLAATASLLEDTGRGVSAAVSGMTWTSPAGDAARAAAQDLVQGVGTLAESFTLQAEAVRRAAAALEAAQTLLAAAVEVAAEHGLQVLEDGEVTAPPPVLHSADASDDELRRIADDMAAAAEARVRARAMATQALASAEEADRDAATVLRAGDRLGAMLAAIAPGVNGFLGAAQPIGLYAALVSTGLLEAVDGRAVPAAGTDPYDVSAWWASLPPTQQAALAVRSPELLGGLDGLPGSVRDAANRQRLAAERAALEAEVARLRQELEDNWFDGRFTDDDARLEHTLGKLAALDRIEEVLGRPGAQQRHLLVLDSSGEQLKAAVAVGDVDAAEHVAVFTPGLTTTVQDSLVRYDREIAALQRQSDDLAAQGGGGRVAAVSWLGYEAPQWSDTWRPSRSVARDDAAATGAVRLASFLNGLDAARAEPAHVTALGHSYGSLTTGLALQRGTGVDDVVFFGSPGIGTSDIQDLGLQPGRVYVVEARRDPVADFAAFGIDPNQLNGVTGLSAAASVVDGEPLAESVGHSGYLTEDTTSQYAMAAVTAGMPERAPRSEGRGFGDVLQTPVPWAQ